MNDKPYSDQVGNVILTVFAVCLIIVMIALTIWLWRALV